MTARQGTYQVTRSTPTQLNSTDITHETVRQAFGDVLRSLRLRVRRSQERYAKEMDIDRTYVSTLERGHREPTLGFLFGMSPGLKVRPAIIVALTERRVGAMQDPQFDRSTSPLTLTRTDLRNARSLAEVPDIPTVRRAVATVVQALRLRGEWNHPTYAKKAGIHPSYEIQIEYGEINPTLTTILLLSAGAAVPAQSFVNAVELLAQANGAP